MTSFVRLSNFDNVVTATITLQANETIEGIKTLQSVPTGHKIASCDIKKGNQVTKYAQCIGYASVDITAGEHVHTHNVEFRNTQTDYEFSTEKNPVDFVAHDARDTFMGFRRANGSIGTRNYIAIVTSVNCSATAARRIADAFGPDELRAYPNVDGVVAFVHGTGCGMAGDGEGFEALQRVMWGYARHPNHAAVLMVGLGCEMNQIDWLLDAYGIKQGPLFQTMNIQNVAGLAKTIEVGIKKVKDSKLICNFHKSFLN
jgi:altronate hydrolase